MRTRINYKKVNTTYEVQAINEQRMKMRRVFNYRRRQLESFGYTIVPNKSNNISLIDRFIPNKLVDNYYNIEFNLFKTASDIV
jgi:hypothetical protein